MMAGTTELALPAGFVVRADAVDAPVRNLTFHLHTV